MCISLIRVGGVCAGEGEKSLYERFLRRFSMAGAVVGQDGPCRIPPWAERPWSAAFLESLFLQQQGTHSPGWWLRSWGSFSLAKKAESKVYRVLMEKDDIDV